MKTWIGRTAGRTVSAALALGCLTGPAFAYMGPGAGLTALGSLVALMGAIALAVVGFLWYPVKRLMARRKAPHDNAPPAAKDDRRSASR